MMKHIDILSWQALLFKAKIHYTSFPVASLQRVGNFPVVKRGYVLSRTTSNNRIWSCGRPGTELTTGISGVKSWKQRRCCRGMLRDDDDELPRLQGSYGETCV